MSELDLSDTALETAADRAWTFTYTDIDMNGTQKAKSVVADGTDADYADLRGKTVHREYEEPTHIVIVEVTDDE